MANEKPLTDAYGRAYFGSRYSPSTGRDTVWKAICGYLQRFIPDRGVVLDLGAGYCSFINNVRAGEKHAVDIFPGFTSYAGAEVKTHVGDCTRLDFLPERRFDAVFASNLLEHLTREATEGVLREARRVLKVGGRLILLQPNFRYAYPVYFDDYTHIQIFTHVGLADLLSAHGFTVEAVEPRFVPFSFKSRLPTWGWLVRLYLRLPFRPLARQMLVVARAAE